MIDSERARSLPYPLCFWVKLRALFREDKLRDETPVSQAALKVVPAQREVVELYYRRPSCFFLSEAGWGEIDLLKDGQPTAFKRSAHRRGADKETRRLVRRPRQRKYRCSFSSLLNLVTREAPARFKHSGHLARQSRLVSDVHGNGVRPDMIKGAIWNGKASAFACRSRPDP